MHSAPFGFPWYFGLVVATAVAAGCSNQPPANDGIEHGYGTFGGSSTPGSQSENAGGSDGYKPFDGGALDASKLPGDGLNGAEVDAGAIGPPTPAAGPLTAAQCGNCHVAIYQQWQTSMHSHALVSPTVIAQTNQDLTQTLNNAANPDPQKFCVNCHGPNISAQVQVATMPPAAPNWKDGVTCTDCHQFNGTPAKASGGFQNGYAGAAGYQKGFVASNLNLGELTDPVGNSAHSSQQGTDFANPNKLCANCHEVWIDYNADRVVEKGSDLALQTTWDEYTEYRALGGTETCVSCHMPANPDQTRIAEGAQIPAQQFQTAPTRVAHNHSFVGVDTDLSDTAQQQATLAARTALAQKAAFFQIDRNSIDFGNNINFGVFISNFGTGHNLPSGFAFARQLWIEITATDSTGQPFFTSGVLQNPGDDLCDPDGLEEFGSPMPPFFQNCNFTDDELTTFQQKLVSLAFSEFDGSDPFDPAGLTQAVQVGNETWLQFLHGGVVARQRVNFDGVAVKPLKPFTSAEFNYSIPLDRVDLNGNSDFNGNGNGNGNFNGSTQGVTIQARLLMRALPPYFLRALGSGQAASETQVAPLISNLQTIVMATDSVSF